MTFIKSVKTCLRKYAVFKGRASVAEFWWFCLFSFVLQWVSRMVGALLFISQSYEVQRTGSDTIWAIVALALVLPSLTVSARRLHDINRSGWWTAIALTVIGIIPLILWWLKPGDSGANPHGDSVSA